MKLSSQLIGEMFCKAMAAVTQVPYSFRVDEDYAGVVFFNGNEVPQNAVEQPQADGYIIGGIYCDVDVEIPGVAFSLSGSKMKRTPRKAKGYEAWLMVSHPGSRWEPPSSDEKTICKSVNPAECVMKLIETMLMDQVSNVIEGYAMAAEQEEIDAAVVAEERRIEEGQARWSETGSTRHC